VARNLRNLTRNSLKYLIKNADNVKTLIADSTYGLQITIPDNNSSAFSIRTNPNIFVIDTLADTIQLTGSVYISGSLYANEYNVDTITTTITNIDQLGSTKFGDTSDDTHQFTGSVRVSMPDNHATACVFKEGSTAYMEFDTTDGGEDIRMKRFTAFEGPNFDPKIMFEGSNGGTIEIPDNNANALRIREGTNTYLTFVTTNSSEVVQFNKPPQLADDVKFYFGTDGDATLAYDEANTNKLIISGAAGGFDINMTDNIASAFAITEAGTTYLKVVTTNGQEGTQFHKTTQIRDDVKLYFGDAGEVTLVYDEANTNKLIISGAAGGFDINMADNAASAFEITETGTSYMTFTTTNDQEEIVVNKNLFMRAGDLKIENDFHNAAFEVTMDDGSAGSAEILYYEPNADTTLTKGGIYFLHTDGTWDEADADAAATAKQLLGIALGTSARTDGMLIRGFVKIPSTEVLNVPGSGASDGLPVYISTTAAHIDFTAPSASGDIVRIVGYCIDDDSSDILLYFCPDKTWVEIA